MIETAFEAFERNKTTIKKQMDVLKAFLSSYEENKSKINWGHVGDMASVSNQLGEIIEQFGLKV